MTRLRRRLSRAALSTAAVIAFSMAPAFAKKQQSDAQIREEIIRQSIESYPGNCPCPYNLASNGSRCGKRSAWNRAGGYAPKCYPEDVTAEDVKLYYAGSRP